MTVILPGLWGDQSSTRLHFWSFDDFFPVQHNLLFLRPAGEQSSWAAATFALISKYLPVKPPPHWQPTWQMVHTVPDLDAQMAAGPQNTKTIKKRSAGDDRRPTLDCRRWRKPPLKWTSLITSQLCGAVWHSSLECLLQECDFKKKHTHTHKRGRTINRSEGENVISYLARSLAQRHWSKHTEMIRLWEGLWRTSPVIRWEAAGIVPMVRWMTGGNRDLLASEWVNACAAWFKWSQ